MKDYKDDSRTLRDYWLGRIEAEEDAHKKYREDAKAAFKAYRDPDKRTKFPIYWSTVQVVLAAIYAREPKPDVRKRNSTDPKSADNIAQAIERAIAFFQDTEDYHRSILPAIEDYQVGGLGIAKVELDTETEQVPVLDPATEEPMVVDGEEVSEEVIKKQRIRIIHWPWCQFRWEPAAKWERVTWISFDHILTKEEIKRQFGIEVKDKEGGKPGDSETSAQKYGPTYTVHEIWDKETKRRIFVSECHPKELEVGAVPLELDGFWPCPKPLVLGVPTDDFVPSPEYDKIKSQCEFIDDLTYRIQTLAKGIRNVGFFDESFSELGNLESASDTVYFPVRDLLNRIDAANSGGKALGGVLVELDNTSKAQTLGIMMEQLQAAKNELFETLGIADIIRGASQAQETATAQQIKGQWANVRIGPKIQDVGKFIRSLLRIVAEVICEHLTPDELARVSGMQLTPEELETLKSDGRVYSVDIETDATLAQDEQAEKNQRLEVLKTATEYVNGFLPAVQQGMIPADVAKEFLLFAIASFKYGRQLQDVIQQLPGQAQQLQQAQQQIQQLTQQGQQVSEQLQQAQQQLAKYSEGEEQRANALNRADVDLKDAQTLKTRAEASVAAQPAPEAPMELPDPADQGLKAAQARKADAEAIKTQVETALMPQKMQQEADIKREGNALRAQNRPPARPV